ncbi:MAG: ABC transporter ATP-binding protein [Candidatus Korarchaeota archaeon NZ13-K]|nr:MAG: ABC transporter ATP-binding protein [Candidatus Korarchaeota archaeon NZ13-K]
MLELDRVSKRFPSDGEELEVIREVSFSLREGELVSIVGPSGCGKSTILRMIAGIERPSSGRITFYGREIDSPDPRISMIFQSFALVPWLKVLEQVELPLRARGVRNSREIARKWLSLVGLSEFEEFLPKELSGGMRQRVGIARALAVEPSLLLMDEPFSSLDELTAETLRHEILELWKSSPSLKSIILVTHNIEEAVLMSDRVVVLSRRPSVVLRVVNIDLPRPRNRRDEGIYEKVDEIYSLLS